MRQLANTTPAPKLAGRRPADRIIPPRQLPILQAKLVVNTPGDTREQEADRVSQQVLRMPTSQQQDACACGGTCPDCQMKVRSPAVQAKPAGPAVEHAEAPPSVHEALRSPSQSLDPVTRAFMEPRFGRDFSHVRIHSGPAADRSARDVRARAYTVGGDIVIAGNQFSPATEAGRSLLAHELTHVVQQSGLGAPCLLSRNPEPRGPTYGNLPRHSPLEVFDDAIVRLKKVGATWMEVGPKHSRLAVGHYDFVVKDGEIVAVRSTRRGGALGHTESASGERVNWAGEVEFKGGEVMSWNNRSGHYRSLSSMREPALQAGLPQGKFSRHLETGESRLGPQLPVEQPATRPRTPGEPPKVGPGPPRIEELQKRYGGPAASSTEVPSTVTTAVSEEASSILKVEGPGFWARRVEAVKTGVTSGLRGALSAPNLASMLPEVVLAIADKVAAREAIKAIQINFLKEGFAKGVAAGVMHWSEDEVSSNLKNRVTAFRIQGLEDPAGFLKRSQIFKLAEAYENYGVDVGYSYGSTRSPNWKNELQRRGLAALAKRGYHFGDDPQALFEYDFIDKLAWVLRSTTNAIVEPAIRVE